MLYIPRKNDDDRFILISFYYNRSIIVLYTIILCPPISINFFITSYCILINIIFHITFYFILIIIIIYIIFCFNLIFNTLYDIIGTESWSTWNCFQNCLKSGCKSFAEDSEAIEIIFLKRCVSVVIQRLARSSDPWTTDTLKGVINILTFAENRRLCGNVPLAVPGSKKSMALKGSKISPLESVPRSLLNLDGDEKRMQNNEELQMMSYLTDLMSSLRKSIERNGAVGDEFTALKIGFNIILGEKKHCSAYVRIIELHSINFKEYQVCSMFLMSDY